jgi:hypothetical protein
MNIKMMSLTAVLFAAATSFAQARDYRSHPVQQGYAVRKDQSRLYDYYDGGFSTGYVNGSQGRNVSPASPNFGIEQER